VDRTQFQIPARSQILRLPAIVRFQKKRFRQQRDELIVLMKEDKTDFEVDWKPIHESGSTFAACRLKRISDFRLDFLPTSTFVVSSLFFFIGGLFVIVRGIFYLQLDNNEFYTVLILGSLFVLSGGYLIFIGKYRVIFKMIDGNWRISKSNIFMTRVKFLPKKTLHAIQVLEKNYDSNQYYELNVVYEDGTRENILNQGGRDLVIDSATILGETIKIPLLNGVKVGTRISKWGEFGPFR